MKKPVTIRSVCEHIHRDFVKKFKYARVWGKSAKFPGQDFRKLGKVLEDGDIGRKTIKVLNSAMIFRNMESRLYKLLDGDQRVYYKNSARRRKTQEKFMGGWLDNRTD